MVGGGGLWQEGYGWVYKMVERTGGSIVVKRNLLIILLKEYSLAVKLKFFIS